MKNLILIICGALLCAIPVHGLFQFGNGDLFAEGRATVSYDSNLFLRDIDTKEDFLATLYGGIGFIQKEQSVLNVELDLVPRNT
jgi:hypothetical protein